MSSQAPLHTAGAMRKYDRAELIADATVHVTGVAGALIGGTALVLFAPEFMAALVYSAALVTVLGTSAAYNMWPISRTKWILRRFDHAMIFFLIAGTYTPFLSHMENSLVAAVLGVGVWTIALIGVVLKLAWPDRFERLAIVLYIALGWSGLLAYDTIIDVLPPSTVWLIGAGGMLYTFGVFFHAWNSLRFQNAVWHAFVLVACACHYGAVLDRLVLTDT